MTMKTIHRMSWVWVWAVVALACVTCACGGSVAGAGADGGGGPDGGSDQSYPPVAQTPPGPSPVCPDDAPAVGTPCTQNMLQCEYGNAWWDVACDVVVQCMSGQWAADTSLGGTCAPKPGPNSADCPPAIPMDLGPNDNDMMTACSQAGEQCSYRDGTCTCVVSADAAAPSYWECVPGPGCPGIRPPLGSSCMGADAGMECPYELTCGGYAQICQGGVWQSSSSSSGC
jgi:hypothetical protein